MESMMKANFRRGRIGASALLTVAALTAGVLSPVAAHASDSLSTDGILSAITDAAPEVLQNVANGVTSDSARESVSTKIDNISVTVPQNASNGISLDPKSGPTVEVGLPFAERADESTVVSNGIVAYDNNNGSVTVPVVKDDGSVQINTIIKNSNAPSRYEYPITLPTGGSASLTTDGGVSLTNVNGAFIGGFAPAWAKDANGVEVATHYEISGSRLTQVINHEANGVVYPVVADPWFGIGLIDHVKWVTNVPYGPTLQVYPTWWGRYTGYAARWAAWDETIKLGGKAANKQTMADQFYCHWDVVRIASPEKASWNLDSKRPNVGYLATVQAKCNPR